MTETAFPTVAQTTSDEGPPEIQSLEDLRAHLLQAHGVTVGKDDPILMLATIHRVFLEQQHRMFERHKRALTDGLTDVIASAVRGLTANAIAENLERQIRLADRTQREFETQYRRARLLSAVNLAATSVCLPVLIYLVVK